MENRTFREFIANLQAGSRRNQREEEESSAGSSSGNPNPGRSDSMLARFRELLEGSRSTSNQPSSRAARDHYEEYRNHHLRERSLLEHLRRSMNPQDRRLDSDRDEDRVYDRMRERRSRYQNSSSGDSSPERNLPPSPISNFKLRPNRHYMDIMDLFKRSTRSYRPKGIAIFIRGAPGSGKSHLARLIVEKEKALGNHRIRILSSNKSNEGRSERYMMEKYQDNMIREFRDELRDGNCNFFIIEMDGGSMMTVKKFQHAAMMFGRVEVYLIELHQRLEEFMNYGRNRRNASQIKQTMEDIINEPPPANIQLIDPSSIYNRNPKVEMMNRISQRSMSQRDYSTEAHRVKPYWKERVLNPLSDLKTTESITDLASQLTELLKIPDVLQTVLESFTDLSLSENFVTNSHKKVNDGITPAVETCEIFKPETVIDYNHEPINSVDERLFIFTVAKVIDYGHRSPENLKDFVKDVDLDKIMKRNKEIKTRRKIIWYLQIAEKPEDTVSNPKYPNNWELIWRDRAGCRTKRKKKKTAKIVKILKANRKKNRANNRKSAQQEETNENIETFKPAVEMVE